MKDEMVGSETTKWASPIVFAPKKTDHYDFTWTTKTCTQLRCGSHNLFQEWLNASIRWATFVCSLRWTPILRINESKMIINDKEKTKLKSHHELYHFVRMPFGLRNASAPFLQAKDEIFFYVK